MSHPAVFLDRDGTIVHDPGYLCDPAAVRVLDGVSDALVRLADAGFRRIVITNQSGISRGLYNASTFDAVQREVERQLADTGASLDATYYCPHLPDDGCACRKPATALHREAAARHDIDLARSWCIGDKLTDVLAARGLGARAVLVRTGEGERSAAEASNRGIAVVADLGAAVDLVVAAR